MPMKSILKIESRPIILTISPKQKKVETKNILIKEKYYKDWRFTLLDMFTKSWWRFTLLDMFTKCW